MTEEPTRSPWPLFAVGEYVIIMAIVSTFSAILIPVIDLAIEMKHQPPIHPFLKFCYDFNPLLFIIGLPVITTVVLGVVFASLRRVLPVQIRRHFCWWIRRPSRQTPQPIVPIPDSRPAITTSILASSATIILLFTATHVRVDRTNRQPIVTWVGPIVDYLPQAISLGWALSVIAIAAGPWAQTHFRSKWNFLAFFGLCLGYINLVGSFLFCAAVYED
jgi:hypothetical protein